MCKHWLRGLCKKGDDCEFLHEFDMTKMPECFFYSKYGELFMLHDLVMKDVDIVWGGAYFRLLSQTVAKIIGFISLMFKLKYVTGAPGIIKPNVATICFDHAHLGLWSRL